MASDSWTCNNTGENSQIGTSAFNANFNSLAYVGYMYGTVYTSNSKNMNSVTDSYYYGNDVTYSDGMYTLVDTISSSNWSSIYNGGLNNNHYTCMGSTTCSKVYYIYYTNSSNMYYIELTGGKKVEDALSDMLDNNTNSSTIKDNIDEWYKTNIEDKGYSSYIEDTVWCNDRSIYQIGGWDSDGGNLIAELYFGSHDKAFNTYNPDLVCNRKVDKFTTDDINGNGDLDYPVGLLTADEIMMAGGLVESINSSYYLNIERTFWTISPCYFHLLDAHNLGSAVMFYIQNTGWFDNNYVVRNIGIRPSISLKSYIEISDGNGNVNNPYIVDIV